DLLAALDRRQPPRIRFDQALLHIAALDRRHRAAQPADALELGQDLGFERIDLPLDLRRTVEDVAMLEKIGLIGEDLLEPQAPLLVPDPRQAQRLVPRRK